MSNVTGIFKQMKDYVYLIINLSLFTAMKELGLIRYTLKLIGFLILMNLKQLLLTSMEVLSKSINKNC